MGTISQTLRMEDKVSPILKEISKNAEDVVKEYKKLDETQTQLMQTQSLIRREFGTQNEMYKKLSRDLEETSNKLKNLVNTGTASNNSLWYEQENFYKKWQESQQGVTEQVSATEAALRRVGSVIKTVIGVYSARQLMNMSDQLIQTEARLGLAIRTNNWTGTPEELATKIFGAAQRSRSNYNSMASTVAKLGMQAGNAFSSQDEIIRFAENISKIFTVSGLDSGGIQSVMYNLTQSMSTGRLLGNDYRILKMNAPEFVKILRDTYANGTQEVLDEMVSKGQISAQMLKNAILGSTKDIEAQFEQMPVTWEQAFTSIKNSTQRLLTPVLKIVSKLAKLFYNITNSIVKNWKVISPIFMATVGFLTTLAVLTIALKVKAVASNVALAVSLRTSAAAYLEKAKAAAIAGQAVDLESVKSAQAALNNVTLVKSIGKVAAAFGTVVIAANLVAFANEKITGKTLSAVGLIGAAIGMLVGTIKTIIAPLANLIIGAINLVVGGFTKGIDGMKAALYDFVGAFYGALAGMKNPFTGNNIFSNAEEYRNNSINAKAKAAALRNNEEPFLSYWKVNSLGLNVAEYTKKGYDLAEEFSKSTSTAFDESELSDATKNIEEMLSNVGGAGGAIKTTLSDEDIKLLLDIATRDYKLNYQQITPEITMTFGDIRETADIDVITEELATRMQEVVNSDLEVVMA